MLGWFSRLPRAAAPRPAANHVALGTFCHNAAALREAGLRRWAGPFDWLFSSPGMIVACLDDDFAALLDPGQLESVGPAERSHGAKRQCRHPVYERRYNLPIIFNHHDPASSGADLRRLQRSVRRLRGILHGRDPNVFYVMSEVPWPEAELTRLAVTLAGFGRQNTLVVVTLAVGEGPRRHAVTQVEGPGCARLDVHVTTRSRSLGAAFADPVDDAHLREVLITLAAGLHPAERGPGRALGTNRVAD